MAHYASVGAASHPTRNPKDSGSGTSVESIVRLEDERQASALAPIGYSETAPPLTASWRLEALSQTEKDKVHRILQACRDRDLNELRELGTSEGGLIEDEVRRTACMYTAT